MKRLISIIAPMYNEENLVNEYCSEVKNVISQFYKKYDFEIVLVNDGSSDNTYGKMLEEQKKNKKEISVICLSRNFGLEGAINAGLTKAKGDAVIVMDADLQDPPKLMIDMINKWEEGADIVIAKRQTRENDNLFKRTSANIYYCILDALSGKIKLERNAANFRLLSKKVVDQILLLPETNTVFRVAVPFVGMKTDIVYYSRDKRYAGKTKYNLKKMIDCALDGITSISIEPLRKMSLLVIIPLLIFFISLIFIVTTKNNLMFWLLIIICCILSITLMIMLLMIGEYIAQIMLETKHRPNSIIYEYIPSNNAEVR